MVGVGGGFSRGGSEDDERLMRGEEESVLWFTAEDPDDD